MPTKGITMKQADNRLAEKLGHQARYGYDLNHMKMWQYRESVAIIRAQRSRNRLLLFILIGAMIAVVIGAV